MTDRMEVWCKRLYKMYSHVPGKDIDAIVCAILYDYKIDRIKLEECKLLLYDMFIEQLRASRMEAKEGEQNV